MSTKDAFSKADIELIVKADKYRESMIPTADFKSRFPAWHGWIIVDAFMAGYRAALKDKEDASGQT